MLKLGLLRHCVRDRPVDGEWRWKPDYALGYAGAQADIVEDGMPAQTTRPPGRITRKAAGTSAPGVRYHMISISAIALVAGEAGGFTGIFPRRAAILADTARVAEPRHANAISDLEMIDPFADATQCS